MKETAAPEGAAVSLHLLLFVIRCGQSNRKGTTMDIVEIDTSGVVWPKTPAVKKQMRDYIHKTARENGFREFATMTFRCLNGIESPGADPYPPEGWEYLTEFFPDCEPHQVRDERTVYPDIRVLARSL